jgi:hypothetical protein
MEMSGQLHVPAAVPQGKSLWYPLDRRLSGSHTIFLLENLNSRDRSEDLGVEGKILLDWILGKWGGEV